MEVTFPAIFLFLFKNRFSVLEYEAKISLTTKFIYFIHVIHSIIMPNYVSLKSLHQIQRSFNLNFPNGSIHFTAK